MRRALIHFILLFAAVAFTAIASPGVIAQTSRPTSPVSAYDGQVIRKAHGDTTAVATKSSSSTLDFPRLALAMGIVLAVILGVRWIVIRTVPGMKTHGSSKSIRVLARTAIAPRQQVVLIQVGRRVIVVGDSQGQLTSLAQIDDADEIAALVGQTESDQLAEPASSRFGGVFSRAQREFDEPTSSNESAEVATGNIQTPDPAIKDASEEISGLIARMRSLTKELGRG